MAKVKKADSKNTPPPHIAALLKNSPEDVFRKAFCFIMEFRRAHD